ncbi:MAG: glycosyltransferase [Clostridiales bacterium]|nr:glycosyltransferase [Clostridiales bacterium]
MKFSVVVPVCNVEKYLAECLDSILKQNISSLEVVCVNDGSTDSSLSILREFAKSDSRVVVVDKPNSGYGDSVNIGINRASGDYIGIVESDDIVVDGIFQKMLTIAKNTGVDFVKGTFNFYQAESCTRNLHPNFMNLPCDKIISVNEYPELFFTAPSIWSGVYKRSFLDENKIRFLPTPGASYQDTSFAFKVWATAKSVYLLSDPVIDYRQDSSGSSSNISKKVFNIFNETKEMERFIKENELERFYPEFVKTKFISYAWTLARLNENDKRKFFLRWIPELTSEFEKGYFVKKYWDDYNWNYIHQLVFNPQQSIENVCSSTPILAPAFSKIEILSKITPVYIYGAGKYGQIALKKLKVHGVNTSAFVVSSRDDNPGSVDGIPVIQLDEIDKDGIIFIGLSEKYKMEVLKLLKDRWLFNNVFEI